MPIDDAMPVRLEAAGTKPEEAEELLTELYGGKLHVAASDAPFSYRYAAIGDETMTLRTSKFGGRLAGELQPTDEVVVQWLQSGTSVLDTGGQPFQMTHGVPVPLLAHRSFAFEMDTYEQRLVHLSRPLVERVAAEQGADVSGGIVFDPTMAPSEQAVRTWHNTVSLVSHTLRESTPGRLLHAEMARLVSASLLEMYPQQQTGNEAGSGASRSAHVQAAVEYVHQNVHLPITTTTLAKHLDVSLRALQEAFQRDLQTTPNAFIRRVRLERVRQELRAADPTTTTVRQVASAWGFAHLGRFSQQYTAEFSEYPKDTLANT
ncbi:helix-turn-helix domain-containing protein [Curtobacterium sp. ME12]|uniref:helix-turn-helix domain-containing protein n=1 Tax=Curtobacterium sp. ME12 TaxID=2744253 RepID=UPI0015F48B34|nr:helix-turn-helix domain-containing protein [Curtobacterium sp. ME12]